MNYKKIHIVGTNGKGSISKYLNDNLINNGKKIGLFTSPHILNVEERIKVNDLNISFIDLQHHMTNIFINFPNYSFGFFQLIFLSTLAYFEGKQIDVAIFEAGIGAKKDIVNFLNFDTTIFTSIDIDHEKILGNKIEKIAKDKSFAIKKNNKIFYPNTICETAQLILNDRAKFVENNFLNIVNIKSKNVHSQNQELAKFILKKEFAINANLFLLPTGRAQAIEINDLTHFIDVGHNVQAIDETLKYFNDKKIYFENFVVSLSFNKNVKEIMKKFDNKITFVYQNKSDKALKINEYPNEFQKINSLKKFIHFINQKTLFIGSFYFIEEILRLAKYDISTKK